MTPEDAREKQGYDPVRSSRTPEWFLNHEHKRKENKNEKKIFFLFCLFSFVFVINTPERYSRETEVYDDPRESSRTPEWFSNHEHKRKENKNKNISASYCDISRK
jgi:hypothetical protein